MSLSQGHDTIVWYIIKIQLDSDKLWPGHCFRYVYTVTMISEIWPLVKVMSPTHDQPLGYGQQLWIKKYYPNPTWQWGVMAQTPILGMCALWPWVKVMTHSSVIDNKCVKYYPDPTWQWGIMARTRDVENFFSMSDIRSDKLRKFVRPNENMPDRIYILHNSTPFFFRNITKYLAWCSIT